MWLVTWKRKFRLLIANILSSLVACYSLDTLVSRVNKPRSRERQLFVRSTRLNGWSNLSIAMKATLASDPETVNTPLFLRVSIKRPWQIKFIEKPCCNHGCISYCGNKSGASRNRREKSHSSRSSTNCRRCSEKSSQREESQLAGSLLCKELHSEV